MRSLSRGILAAPLVVIALTAVTAPALAAETSNSEFVIIRDGTVFPDDLYAGGIQVIVDGTLDGDLVAFAAEEIVINGTVTGSVMALTPRVEVNGEIDGTLRMTGDTLAVAGEVGGDVVAAARDIRLGPSSEVRGDVLVWAWRVRALGTVGADLTGTQRHLELAGEVEGNVDVSVTRLTIVDDLAVTGDLGYRSSAEPGGLERASVEGVVVEKTPLPPNVRVRALGLLGRFLVVVVLSVAALTVAYGWPQQTAAAISEVGRRPVRRWLTGAAILFSPLLVVAVTGSILGLAPAAVAFPLLALLVPLILVLIGLSLALALVAGAPMVGWLGGLLVKRLDLYGSILLGSIVTGVAWWLPVVGWVVPVVVLPAGLGAWIAARRDQSSVSSAPSSGASS
jgi:cytoskeletal protein CcmA (bactofilin family)